MKSVLTIRAGKRALEHIRAQGLGASDIEIVPGAAGGPKALGIAGLDRAVFGEWLPAAPGVRHLIGSSIGAWRFAAACRCDPLVALDAFAQAYTAQTYPRRPTRRFVSESARTMLTALFSGREDEILAHPHYRLHILTVRGRWPLTRDSALTTSLGFGMAAMANALGRRHLARFIERAIFHDSREHPAFFRTGSRFDAFNTHEIALDRGNLVEALLASASIPMVLEGVLDIPSAPAGVYWDGGLIDYHLHLPYHRATGLVLYPHFTDRIVPGWLDKGMSWRHARGEWLDNVVLVAPSREYLAGLPNGRLPDRRDFARFAGANEERMKHWRAAISESERLGDAFLDFTRRPDPACVLPL
ncbi:MAG TPA: patatin-like phospholipase family protein [Usitatibacter sp.]|nr:patatin-like phospholipase family protein [Usitatibacter sp.]